MHPIDEYRIKILSSLRYEARSVSVRDYIGQKGDIHTIRTMRDAGWVMIRTIRGVKVIAVTMEGRRVLKCFERIYR